MSIPESVTKNRIKLAFSEEDKLERLYNLVYFGMREIFLGHHICGRPFCADDLHTVSLDIIWKKFTDFVGKAG